MNVGRRDSCEVRLPAGAVARCERALAERPRLAAAAWRDVRVGPCPTLNKRRRPVRAGGKVRRKYSCLLNPDLFREVLV